MGDLAFRIWAWMVNDCTFFFCFLLFGQDGLMFFVCILLHFGISCTYTNVLPLMDYELYEKVVVIIH